MYKYFISFFCQSHGANGYGNMDIVTEGPITGPDDIKYLERLIEQRKGNVSNVIIMNFRQFDSDS